MFCRDRYSLIIVLIGVDEISIFIDFENTCLIGNGMSYFFMNESILLIQEYYQIKYLT